MVNPEASCDALVAVAFAIVSYFFNFASLFAAASLVALILLANLSEASAAATLSAPNVCSVIPNSARIALDVSALKPAFCKCCFN